MNKTAAAGVVLALAGTAAAAAQTGSISFRRVPAVSTRPNEAAAIAG